jgi:hypothetical protein
MFRDIWNAHNTIPDFLELRSICKGRNKLGVRRIVSQWPDKEIGANHTSPPTRFPFSRCYLSSGKQQQIERRQALLTVNYFPMNRTAGRRASTHAYDDAEET